MAISFDDLYRSRVYTTKGKPVGRVVNVLFAFDEPKVVGFVVERPRLLFLYDRKDRMLARGLTSLDHGDILVRDDRQAWDKRAAQLLDLNWDTTVIWTGMPVRTEAGAKLGSVKNGRFDYATGALHAIEITSGAVADAAVGTRSIEAANVRGYRDGWIFVADEVAERDTTGGAAAVAGKGAAVAKKQVGDAATAAGAAAKSAVRYGKAAAQVAASSESGKKAVGWLKAMRDEIVDAMGDPDDDD